MIMAKERLGLYLSDNRVKEIQSMLPNLQSKVESFPMLKQENVISMSTADKFYEIGTKRIYVEVDGKPVESYFTNQDTNKIER